MFGTTFSYVVSASEGISLFFKHSSRGASSESELDNSILVQINKRREGCNKKVMVYYFGEKLVRWDVYFGPESAYICFMFGFKVILQLFHVK